MAGDHQNPNSTQNNSPSASSSRAPTETGTSTSGYSGRLKYPNPPNSGYSGGEKPHFPNPPDAVNPDPATLREQWRFAIKQYSKWYSHAWGTAILAGAAFFALGWVVKGSNPLPSKHNPREEHNPPSLDRDGAHQSR